MPGISFDYFMQFFTATILEWKHLLKQDAYKDIIIDSLSFLKKEGSIVVHGFVIMPNHIHLIWRIQDGFVQDKIQMRFLKYTGQQMKFRLIDTNDNRLQRFKVKAKDREYQFWERNALSVGLWNDDVLLQKLTYIHNNPVKEHWNLSPTPEAYKYSSAKFYETGIDDFGLLTHFRE